MVGRKLTGIGGRRIIAALQRAGFKTVRVTGNHHVLRKPGSPALKVIVPVHGAKDIPIGTVLSIVRQSGLSTEDFAELL